MAREESLGDAIVRIGADLGPLIQQLASAHEKIVGFVQATAIGAVIAAPFVLAGSVIRKALSSWIDEEAGISRMNSMLTAMGMNAEVTSGKIEKLAKAISMSTATTDRQVRSMATQAAQMGVSEENIESVVTAAIGLGAMRGTSPEMMIRPLMNASRGYSGMLLRLFPQIRAAKTEQERFNQVLELAGKGMTVAQEATNTIIGAYRQMKRAIDEVWDSLGKGLFGDAGIAGEIKNITAAIHMMRKAVELGFKTGVLAGFDVKGWGDWAIKALIHVTAAILTIPTVIQAIYKLFSDSDKLFRVFSEVMQSAGKILLTTIIEGFNALTGLFKGLGIVLARSFTSKLEDIPFLRVPLRAARTKALNSMSDEQLFRLYNKSPGAQAALSSPNSLGASWAAVKSWMGSFGSKGAMSAAEKKAIREQVIFALAESGGDVLTEFFNGEEMTEAIKESFGRIPKAGKKVAETILKEIERLNKVIKLETNEDIVGTFRQQRDALIAAFEQVKEQMDTPPEIKPWGEEGEGKDAQEKASLSIVSMADQWRKMQEGISKSAEDKAIRKATEATAKNTNKHNELFERFLQQNKESAVWFDGAPLWVGEA